MTEQQTLWDKTIQRQFEEFHRAHPEVWEMLHELAHQALDRGRRRVGMKQLFEVLRWERFINGLPDGGEDFKLNNSYTSRYARLLMDLCPDLDGMFETRSLRS